MHRGAQLLILSLTLAAFFSVLTRRAALNSIQVANLFEGDAAESALALGARLALGASGIYELELIKNISDKLASKLVEKRVAIQAQAKTLSCPEIHKAFEIVNGIGTQGSSKLAAYLTIGTEQCKDSISAPRRSSAPSPRKRRAKS